MVVGLEAGPLVERDDEVALLGAALHAARAGEGAVVVLEGAAGIGKTRLLGAVRDAAAREGMTALFARAADLEREFAWGVVRQLFEPALGRLAAKEREVALAGAARLAGAVLVPPDASPPAGRAFGDEGAVMHGMYWLCANLARDRPLLVAVDDAHWSDLPSLRFLAYLARRIDGLPVALMCASRLGESQREEELLAGIAAEPGAALVRPGPLSADAVATVLGRRLGSSPSARLAHACHEATRGNPFLVEELARSLREGELDPEIVASEPIADVGPRSVARAITRRLRGLATRAVEVAHAVSVLGRDVDLRGIAELAELDREEVVAAVDALIAAEILTPSRPLDFSHPLVRGAIYADLPPARRAELHRRAARLLAAEGAAAGRTAAHLLPTAPTGDPWVVDALRRAASEAMAHGAPPTAVAYLERAIAEPPEVRERGSVLAELARAEAADARVTLAGANLRRAIEAAAPGARATLMLELARAVCVADWERGGLIYLEALDELGQDDPLAVVLEGELITIALNVFSLGERVRPILERRLAELAAGEVDDPLLLGALGLALAATTPPASAGAAVAALAADAALIEYNTNLPGTVGNALLFAGELEASARYYGAVREWAIRRGWRNGVAWSNSARARVSLQLGDVRRAEEEARLAFETLETSSLEASSIQRGYFVGHLGEVLIERGAFEEADAILSGYPIADSARTYGDVLVLCARSSLRLAQGRPSDALADARAIAPPGLEDVNPAVAPWRAHAAIAHAALGHRAEARELADDNLSLARSFGAPHAVAGALRLSAHCAEKQEAAAHLLQEAVAVVEGTAARLEHARAIIELGALLRRSGRRRAARDELLRGLDLAHRCGASVLVERARGELRLAGARPRRALISGVDALTVAERRVAQLAAEGMTNQEIAQALFVTSRTVEGHLTHAYQKLGISSRRELPRALELGAADAIG